MILVTGGTGLVGTHLLFDLTTQQQQVRAIKRTNSNLESVREVFCYYSDNGNQLFDAIEWVDGDLTDINSLLEAMEGVTHVYHCAAMVSFQPGDAAALLKANGEGTANVVNAALDRNVKKLCYVSSTAAIGKTLREEHLDESCWWKASNENSNYAISKYSGEREVWRASEEGLTTVIVNPSIIVGPGNWNKSSVSVFKTIWNGFKYYTTGINGFVDARDVSRAMMQLMESDIHNERFLLVGKNTTYKEFFTLIAQSMNKPVPKKEASEWMTGLGWRIQRLQSMFTGKASGLTKETHISSHCKYHYSNKKIKEALGFEFTSLKEAVDNTGKFFAQKMG